MHLCRHPLAAIAQCVGGKSVACWGKCAKLEVAPEHLVGMQREEQQAGNLLAGRGSPWLVPGRWGWLGIWLVSLYS